jgi:threonylcarbamoyladenosine tRNA methylthiotransferase MtaB
LPTVIIETHGCKLNQADSQALARRFTQAGYQVVGPAQSADVYVLDTCTVTQVADRKARHALRAARRRNPKALIVATGCYAQRAPTELETIKEVDLVLGNTDKDVLVQEIVSLQKDAFSPCAIGEESVVEDGWERGTGVHRARAMVKIQEGCNQVCTYCIVPKVRGRERSIPADDLVAQILALEEEGFQEVVLTGTQLVSYGFDIPGSSLERLIELLLNKTTIPRIRVSSLQPQVLEEELLGLWQDSRLCPHFHMPLQSGSDTVLRRMSRRYTADLYVRTAERVRARVPGASITTDVLTGFPGESEEEFQETYRICQEVRFADMHVFPYSVRPGTSAAHFKDRVDPVTKGHRGRLLLHLANEHATEFHKSLLGQVRPVLWESMGTGEYEGKWSGLTDNYVRVYTDDPRPLGNTITGTRLLQERDGSLAGRALHTHLAAVSSV